ncbi:hypothetical protein RB601_009257 [Gaeumannomyces tritici]
MTTIASARGVPDAGDSSKMGAPASHPYTCNSCHVAFRNIELQKGHMRGDWHRYNLKRRVASLAPISSEVFNEKVLLARAATSAEADKVGFERICEACAKTYYSENAYQNHLGSKNHKAKAASRSPSVKDASKAADETSSMISSTFSLGEPTLAHRPKIDLDSDAEAEFSQVIEGIKNTKLAGDAEGDVGRPSPVKRPSNPHLSATGQRKTDHPVSEAADEAGSGSATPVESPKAGEAAYTIKSCLFCNYESPTVALNATHMERIHGMFIPEKQYLVDLEGLLESLQKRVRELHECFVCQKVKASAFAVQTHMRDASHCRIPYTTEEEQLEIGEFYDFRSTYSDGEEDSEDEDDGAEGKRSGGARLGAKRSTTVTGEDGDEIMGGGEGDGWETDSSASSLDSEDLTAVPAERHYHQYERLNKHPHHSTHDTRAHHQKDGWHSHAHKHSHAAFYDEYELHLPTGKHVGHRTYQRYYRQNLRNRPVTEEERAEQKALELAEKNDLENMDVDGLSRISRVNKPNYFAVMTRRASGQGQRGLTGLTKLQVREVTRMERKARSRERGHAQQVDSRYNRRANFQKHFHYSKLGG